MDAALQNTHICDIRMMEYTLNAINEKFIFSYEI